MAKQVFVKGQVYQGKKITSVYRVLDHYLLKLEGNIEKIIYFKDL